MPEIMITLQQMRDNQLCGGDWSKVYKANNGDMNTPFPLKSILDSNDLVDCLWALRCLPEHSNLWRLYAVWCARQVEHLMPDARSKSALDVAEKFAKDDATQEELTAARADSSDALICARRTVKAAAIDEDWAAWADARDSSAASRAAKSACDVGAAAQAAIWAACAASDASRDASEAQKAKLIEILTAGEWI